MKLPLGIIAVLLASLALLIGIGADPLAESLAWDQGMKHTQNAARCDGQAAASGARGAELKTVKDACLARISAKN